MKRRFYVLTTELRLRGCVATGRPSPYLRNPDGTPEPEMIETNMCFARSDGIHLTPTSQHDWNGHTLIMVTGFMSAEHQRVFHDHPEVALMPDLEEEREKLFGEHMKSAQNKFKQRHLDALGVLGMTASHHMGHLWDHLISLPGPFQMSQRHPLWFLHGKEMPSFVVY